MITISPSLYPLLNWGNTLSSATQRGVNGGVALITQPTIDLCNKDVDNDTRWTSAMRTIAKIIVGTTVGVIVRYGSIKLARSSPMFWKGKNDKFKIPEYPGKDFWKKKIDFSNEEHRNINNYANTVGTVIGTGAGLVTNFVIDAPLTKFFTNYLNANVKPNCMKLEAVIHNATSEDKKNTHKKKGEQHLELSA